jgi:hypothetical protein
MPYIKAKEYKKQQKLLEEYKKLKALSRSNTWRCGVCLKMFNTISDLALWRGDAYICNENKIPYFQRVALLTIKGLRQNYLIDNIERNILYYLYKGWRSELILNADECWDLDLKRYCIEKYNDGDFKEDWKQ